MKKELNLLLMQVDIIWEDVGQNLQSFDSLLKGRSGYDLIVFPEMFTTGFTMNTKKAEKMDGLTISWMVKWAKELKTNLCGSIIVQEEDNFYNRFVLVSENGVIGQYDKRHLFGFAGEDRKFKRGEKKVIWDICGWKICPMICYDLRFPVWSSNVEGYDLLLYIASWPKSRKNIWQTLLKARAIENQSYVIGVNRVGIDGANLEYSGDSCVISPLGESLFHYTDSSVSQSLSLYRDEIKLIRAKFPFLSDADKFRFEN